MSQTGKIQLVLSPQAQRYARREAPVEVRRMAARGALPLAPVELATVLFALLHDPDDQVKATAEASLAGLPEGVLGPVLEGRAHPALLSHLAHRLRDSAEACEKIALNAATGDATLAFLATLPHRRVVDVIANNQQRMLRAPEIVEALGDNPLTGRATIDRILSFLGFARPLAEVPEAGADAELAAGRPEDLSDAEAEAALRSILGEDAAEFAHELVAEETQDASSPEAGGNLHALLQNMTIFQKIKLARMGNKEARGLLVRDRNKIVASAAIRSPKITENEVAAFAKMRNVCDEVLRAIAANHDWTRSYQVKLSLATNPKTPPPTALKFLNYLQDRDLCSIMKSKDVPSAISTHARRILSKKGKA